MPGGFLLFYDCDFGPGFFRGVPSFFKRLPSLSRGALEPGLGPRFFAVLDVGDVSWAFGFFLMGAFVAAGVVFLVFGVAVGSSDFTGVGSCESFGTEPLPIMSSVFALLDFEVVLFLLLTLSERSSKLPFASSKEVRVFSVAV